MSSVPSLREWIRDDLLPQIREKRWWVRDISEVLDDREKLSRHASVLYEQAKEVFFASLIIGLICGAVAGGVAAILVWLDANSAVLAELWRTRAWLEATRSVPEFEPSGAGKVFLLVTAVGAWTGYYLGNRWAYQLRSLATVALSLARIEARLDKLQQGHTPPS